MLYNPDYAYVRMPGSEDLWLLGFAAMFFGAIGLLICGVAIWTGLTKQVKDDT